LILQGFSPNANVTVCNYWNWESRVDFTGECRNFCATDCN